MERKEGEGSLVQGHRGLSLHGQTPAEEGMSRNLHPHTEHISQNNSWGVGVALWFLQRTYYCGVRNREQILACRFALKLKF